MRLGRLVEHDERSRAYRVPPSVAPLKSVRHWRHAPITDQGELGSCTCEALVSAMACTPAYEPIMRRYPRLVLDHHLAERLYRVATQVDAFPGAWPPDDTGSSGLAACKAAQRAGYVSGYRWGFGLDDTLQALQNGPVMLGVRWFEGMDNPSADGEIRPTGALRGGHEVCLTGINADARRVWLDNSWGESWGVDGQAWLSWSDLADLLDQDGDAVQLVPVLDVLTWWQRLRVWLGI